MYLKDLDPYRHGVPTPLKDVVAIGWLSVSNDYPHGDIAPGLVDALEELLSSHRVNQMRGYHVCDFCLKAPLTHQTRSGKVIMLGSAELWVPSSQRSTIYAAPDLIYHYVKEHLYLPPDDFVKAVLSARDQEDWDANRECNSRLEAAFSS